MSDNLGNSTIISQTQPDLTGKARVDLDKSEFDAAVWNKGYEVYHESAIKCPCRNTTDSQAKSDCLNCGGSGWVFVNRVDTRMIIQSANVETKFKEWSEEKLGRIRITAMSVDQLCMMDKIILRNTLMTTHQVLHLKQHTDTKYRAFAVYDIKEVDFIYLFNGSTNQLVALTSSQYHIEDGQWIRVDDAVTLPSNPTISIRYKHNPVYYVSDVTRKVMDSRQLIKTKEVTSRDQNMQFPISAMGQMAHYILDSESFNGNKLFDNSTTVCVPNVP